MQKAGVKANFFLFSEHGYPPYGGILISGRNEAMAKFVRTSMESWVSYLNNLAPGNALIKKDNPKMTDDLLAWEVTQIKQHHLIDGGDAATAGWGTMTQTLAENPEFYSQRRFAEGGYRLETGVHHRVC